MDSKETTHKWQFRARFRKNAFGWRSQPAIGRIREAVSEIKKVARKDKVLAAEGAVAFLERLSPALERVDSSSGAIGSAVNKAIADLVAIIASAKAEPATREKWMERLFQAHADDGMPYIELLTDYWGELCVSPKLASHWADQLLDITRKALSPDKDLRGFFHGTTACLSALYTAGRYTELLDVLEAARLWEYKRWAVKALVALGKKAEAIRYAEESRDAWASNLDIDQLCEGILLSSGLVDEAYSRYGLTANRARTYLAWFRRVAKKYPHKTAPEILSDLVEVTPGEEGKWFAAAKSAALYDQAIALANQTPCSPQTLTRAARDFATRNPGFALEAGMTALRWLIDGYGYDITSRDVHEAHSLTMIAADNAGRSQETATRIHRLVAERESSPTLAAIVLRSKLGLS